jgi:transposase
MAAELKHPSQQRYPPELRERAVRLVLETMEQPGTRQGAVGRVARQLGIGTETLRGWVKRVEVDGGRRPGVPTEQQRRLAELERENRELRRANEMADSSGRRNDLDELLQWCHIGERLARPAVETVLNTMEVGCRVLRQVGPFGQVLAQQAVGVLV